MIPAVLTIWATSPLWLYGLGCWQMRREEKSRLVRPPVTQWQQEPDRA